MNNLIGIMQGRLTSPKGRGIQFFPSGAGEIPNEFYKAEKLNLDYIEWLALSNVNSPLLGDFYSCEEIKNLIEDSKVTINSICLDYLKNMDLIRDTDLIFAKKTLTWIANMANRIGCKLLIIPIYEKNMNFPMIKSLISSAIDDYRVKIAFEFLDVNSFTGINFISDLTYQSRMSFRHSLNNYGIGCCFDIGNNYGRDFIKELDNYCIHDMLFHIHIKEKNTNGETVSLGTGVIGREGWKDIFTFLRRVNYLGNFTLEVARGEEGKEKETIKEQLEFVKGLM